uniref:Putative secreted salivary protein n=1 Tax=Ixodes scapularis TaxID=6945 RepID=Q4PN93_IXOSC|nr:putative secreted salivary protein [Ixodes scapularis]
MKASIAALCILVALSCVIAKLREDECRSPYAVTMCEEGSLKYIYSFDNNTNQCVSYQGCGTGKNIFDSYEKCLGECPYGNHHPPGERVTGTQ